MQWQHLTPDQQESVLEGIDYDEYFRWEITEGRFSIRHDSIAFVEYGGSA